MCVPPRPFGNIKKKRRGEGGGGLEHIKAEVEETLSEGRPSSPHAGDPYAPQDAQVSDRDAQTERSSPDAGDPYAPQDGQVSDQDAQIER